MSRDAEDGSNIPTQPDLHVCSRVPRQSGAQVLDPAWLHHCGTVLIWYTVHAHSAETECPTGINLSHTRQPGLQQTQGPLGTRV